MNPHSPDQARLIWDEQGQPLSSTFDDVYFSRQDGLAETRHVFLEHNQLQKRFEQLTTTDDTGTGVFTIAETGFGTGLNFLAAWQLWQQHAPSTAQLHFVSCEKFPLSKPDLIRALRLWPELSSLANELIDAYPTYLPPGLHRLNFAGVRLSLLIADAADGFAQLLPSPDPRWQTPNFTVDAWFLDGFAPSKNPEMWSEELFRVIGLLSREQTTLATFSAAGVVKRGLTSAGFSIQKVPGFGRKREMISARYDGGCSSSTDYSQHRHAPGIYQRSTQPPGVRHAIVIGAGLAGCHTARALAERGWHVQVLDSEAKPAQHGSGNRQGVLYAKLSHKNETLPDFNLHSLLFAQRHYRPFWRMGPTLGAPCGVLQLAYSEKQAQQYQRISEKHALATWLDNRQASEKAGVPLNHGGLYFNGCGWLNPPAVCEQLLNHPLISFKAGQAISAIKQVDSLWQALDDNGESKATAEVLVLATAQQCGSFTQTRHLPLKAIRGQVTHIPATAKSETLRTVLCAKGYIAPSWEQHHSLGATFNLAETDTQLRQEDHLKNMAHLSDFGPVLQASLGNSAHDQLKGRAALRCTTPDYLPVVGPAPDAQQLEQSFAPLSKNAKARLECEASYHPGLYLNTGYGSRGLAYTPLCAEFLAALINRETPPLTQHLAQALHPARFILRNIIRQ
ncbi:bifunctional tRNA (5-methylaminomethyl-2-thiouridine)(34)-methyltransferase MnmD/FAD-dependent 5-carboxymethylaminomethyl-2-thiouridine(34) oxidoreductase MnmC [Gilvimarinus chinensis]|uniref:bifunctional tRNA (5-methylaminomethyl-2-thiouridine)(34)-methyltransferase MnmD/FAD-dependent 5-carboxymethylaminomethyl-2-thiouridine(34) oxidoreductase MnmC n=1 Tax=Gilvimarinus chinensis TaxID=396005 RepID=UPI00035DD3E6|nr:bifunctional tRNA (5-methylaminomethyl-2-thiouridine)(34)-methyltransferase MnmD/FAD-dependent 5-carboxymethylaminomethyl-2-thiouridine(34) oxidoreductase MnmC [Gilvimarinus chinensis]